MNKITSASELHEVIASLEKKRLTQELEIRQQAEAILENLKPVNIIKNTLRDAFSDKAKGNLFRSAIAVGSGLASKKLIVGKSVNVFRKILGTAVEFGIAGLIAKNADKIKDKSSEILQKIFSRRKRLNKIENGRSSDPNLY